MTLTYEQLRVAVLALDFDQKLELMECLEAKLNGPELSNDGMTEVKFDRELDRRAEEARQDPSVVIPWKESMQNIRERLQ